MFIDYGISTLLFDISNISSLVHMTCLHNLDSMWDRWDVSVLEQPRRQQTPPGALKD